MRLWIQAYKQPYAWRNKPTGHDSLSVKDALGVLERACAIADKHPKEIQTGAGIERENGLSFR